ncbi:MAG TPA: Flp pilus assembly protein CpaB [Rhodocyclaceae bacterium]
MRNIRAIVMLVLSLLVGLGAAMMAAAWVQQKGDAATRQVAVAATDIELGSRLNAQMIKLVAWPVGQVPEGSFAAVEDLADRVVKTSVLRGEALLESKLAPVGTKGGLSAVIKEGHRAMTVRVNDVVGVAGFALPGNYVDVVVSTQQDGAGTENRQISKIVLEHILVLAVAQEANRDETRPKVVSAVTLEVTPAQAEKLDLARTVGQLSLVLRNQIDNRNVDTAGITKRQLLVGDDRRAAEPPKSVARPAPRRAVAMAPRRDCVEVVAGGSRSLQCF